MERKNAWETYDKSQEKKVMKLAEQYRQFISAGKTERECVRLTEKMAREAGYISLEEALTSGDTLKPGDKVYAIHKKKLACSGIFSSLLQSLIPVSFCLCLINRNLHTIIVPVCKQNSRQAASIL